METVFALCAILLLAFNLLGIVLAGWRLTRRDTENALVRQKPPVSLVVPLLGVENFTPLTLSRAFELDWPDYELLFCVADELDPVIEEVRKRDAERFALETAGGLFAGRALVLGSIERIDPPNHEARDAQ